MLVSVDPSVVSCGVASWLDGDLISCARISPRAPHATDDLSRARDIARDIAGQLRQRDPSWDLVVETPQHYAPGKGQGPGQDLVPMALVAGAVAALCPGRVWGVLPRTWCGGLKKVTRGDPRDSPRGARIWSRLSEAERAIAAECLQHDVWDAIGIGLHHLGRFGRARGQPGT